MKYFRNLFSKKNAVTKKAHSYTKVYTKEGVYTKREDGLEYFIASDLLK